MKHDDVKNPAHYDLFPGQQAIDIIEAALTPEEFAGYLKGNCLKYRLRAGEKGEPAQCLAKANWYRDRLLGVKPVEATPPPKPADWVMPAVNEAVAQCLAGTISMAEAYVQAASKAPPLEQGCFAVPPPPPGPCIRQNCMAARTVGYFCDDHQSGGRWPEQGTRFDELDNFAPLPPDV